MEKLKAIHPDAVVLGQSMLAFAECSARDEIWDVLEAHGLQEIDPEQWYPQQAWLDVLRDVIGRGNAMFNLVSIGMKLAELFPMPPDIRTMHEALGAVDDIFRMSNPDAEPGIMRTENVEPRHVRIVSATPYPDDFEYGVIYGLARRYLPPDGHLVVRHVDDAPCRKNDGDTCTYDITW